MNCNKIAPLLAEYAEDAAASTQKSLIETHLAECPACARLARDFHAMRGLLRGLPPLHVSAQFETGLAQRMAQARRPSQPSLSNRWTEIFSHTRRAWRPTLAFGAALTVLGGVILFAPRASVPPPPTPSVPARASWEASLVTHCVQQHRSYMANQPLSDPAAQNLVAQLDNSASGDEAGLPAGEDSL